MKRKQLAPHIHADRPIVERYAYVLLALLPILIGALFYYGIRVLVLSFVSCGVFFLCDYLSSKNMYPEMPFHVDYSSLVSGLILAMLVPVSTSVWAMAIAAAFGSLLVKQALGGVGRNLFNPALAARAFLQIAFPMQMVAQEPPLENFWGFSSLFTGKAIVSNGAITQVNVDILDIVSGRVIGMVGTTSLILIALGAVIMIERKLFSIYAPAAFFAVILIGYVPFNWAGAGFEEFLIWMIRGGILFVGVFALQDCTTLPMDKWARCLFGGGAGLLTLILYRFGNASYAMIYPVLLMNILTPVFDYYIRPRAFSKTSWFREVEK
ncbi:MAG: RnfABCDGE type electron transport complex subunit D [Clostridiales bacterium]|nr:RnfABCDGE type electron transport complex subunit D [Clostridiales bacterium]